MLVILKKILKVELDKPVQSSDDLRLIGDPQ